MKRKQNTLTMRQRISRYFLGFFSLTGMMFIFQACYGTPQDFGLDVLIEGKVVSSAEQKAIGDIEIRIEGLDQYTATDQNGQFSLYCPRQSSYMISFSDTDGDANGSYLNQDTTLLLDEDVSELTVNIELSTK